MSENKKVVERHGCIVCAQELIVLAVYTPEGRLVDCAVTSGDGHRVPDDRHLLVACDSHQTKEIETAHQRWQSRNAREIANEEDGD